MSSSNSSCELDPISTKLLKDNIDTLLPGITSIVNISLQNGYFSNKLKEAVIRPLLKKSGLPLVYKNFRPVSNLSFLSKIVEKCVAQQLTDYVKINLLGETLQSAYKSCHSTESAIVKVRSDILENISNRKVTDLILLDLSAAFDTVDHVILLNRLEHRFGITANALNWFSEYLTNRTQQVIIDGTRSGSVTLKQGVPQGSVLGPWCFTYYTSPLGDICRKHGVTFHLYADDTQLYMCFTGGNITDYETTMNKLNNVITDIRKWMYLNKLKLNSDKTEVLFIGTRQQLEKCRDFIRKDQKIGSESIKPVTSVRNLGFYMDERLDGESHIKKTTASCYGNLRKIAKIRKIMSEDTCKIMINSLVTSKLDYCNAGLAGVTSNHIRKLQAVQNMSCRIIKNLRKYDHISQPLMDLHWLKIPERIEFKIGILVHSCVHGSAPAYLKELLSNSNTHATMTLRSRSSYKLDVLPCSNSQARRSAFQYVGPSVWNSIPAPLRAIMDIEIFKKHLKSYLFTKSHPTADVFIY